MRPAVAAALFLAIACRGAGAEEDLARSFAGLQSRVMAAQARLAARRAEVTRFSATLSLTAPPASLNPLCRMVRYKPGSPTERIRRLVNAMAGRIIAANGLSIPQFCGVVLWPGGDFDARLNVVPSKRFSASYSDAEEARLETEAAKLILLRLGTFEKAPNDDVLAALLSHELVHMVRMDGAATLMDDQALSEVGADWNSSDFDRPFFAALERWKLGYTQASEAEADRQGAIYMRRAGYDPAGMAQMISLLDDPESEAGVTDHASPRDRLALIGRQPLAVGAQAVADRPLRPLDEIKRLLRLPARR